MQLNVTRSILRGKIAVPGSKSHTIRAVAIASLADGRSIIRNPLLASDCVSAVMCYQALGANINATSHLQWIVDGTDGSITHAGHPIDVGNSGTTLRIAMGTAALAPKTAKITLTGDRQIRTRPVGPLIDSLNDLGAKAASNTNDGCAPVTVSGSLAGGTTSIKCVTSQYLTSLLLAAPLAKDDTVIDVTLLNEPDYVQMTLDWLSLQRIKYKNDDFKRFTIPGRQKFTPFDATVPADFSSATFFLCAGAMLDADITLTGLDYADSQPDKAVVEYLKQMGADIRIDKAGTHIKPASLKGVRIDMNKTPDALPAMAVAACFAEGTTKLVNVAQARNKETDRIKCMAEELKKAGADVEELPDGLIIHGCKLHAAKFDGRADHRIVMALSLLGMAVDGDTTIKTAEAINVTFPDYVELMNSIGAKMIIK